MILIPEDIQLKIHLASNQEEVLRICKTHSLDEEQVKVAMDSVIINQINTEPDKKVTSLDEDDDFYHCYLTHLEKEMGNETMMAINSTIKSTWSRLNNRKIIEENTNYGLVVGRIQSGKTAHMIGLALKAIQGEVEGDQYDTVIILSGTIEDLRKQSYERISEIGLPMDKVIIVPKGKDLSQDDDAKKAVYSHFRKNSNKKLILVIKKDVRIISVLNNILTSRFMIAKKKRRVMIIDDECDYASMDSNNAEDSADTPNPANITPTNQVIRQLIINLRKSKKPTWYIGYTATPYANILMQENSSTEDSEYGLSLFPRNFIHALPKSRGHLDNEYYFLTGNNHLIDINQIIGERTPTIVDFVLLHVIVKEIKTLRGIDFPHISMIHTDVGTKEHKKTLDNLKKIISRFSKNDRSSTYSRMKRVVHRYFGHLSKSEQRKLFKHLESIDGNAFARLFSNCKTIMLNRKKDEIKIDEYGERILDDEFVYEHEIRYQINSLSAFVVGGNRVSRGLTLKGLTLTWFTRNARTPNYDTMLQMARWCGYRVVGKKSYADLVRIFTTNDLISGFSTIAGVEQHLRNQLEQFTDATDPVEARVWIQQHDGFRVTGRMPSRLGVSNIFGEIWAPNTWTHSPPIFQAENKVEHNQDSYEDFLKFYKLSLKRKLVLSPHNSQYHLATEIKKSKVRLFLQSYIESYATLDNNDTFQKLNLILKQILNDSSGMLSKWNVGLRVPTKKPRIHTHNHISLGVVERNFNEYGFASFIQSGQESNKIDIDSGNERDIPLLLIYLADQDYSPDGVRAFPEDLQHPVILLGIILPPKSLGTGGQLIQRFR